MYPKIADLDSFIWYTIMFMMILLGGMFEFITNWGHVWPCGSDLTGIFEYFYLFYYYVAVFVGDKNSVDIVYAIMYSAYTVDEIVTIQCEINPKYAGSYSVEYKDKTRLKESHLDTNI